MEVVNRVVGWGPEGHLTSFSPTLKVKFSRKVGRDIVRMKRAIEGADRSPSLVTEAEPRRKARLLLSRPQGHGWDASALPVIARLRELLPGAHRWLLPTEAGRHETLLCGFPGAGDKATPVAGEGGPERVLPVPSGRAACSAGSSRGDRSGAFAPPASGDGRSACALPRRVPVTQ